MKLSSIKLPLLALVVFLPGAVLAQGNWTADPVQEQSVRSSHFTLSGGIAVPVGDFADIASGSAKMGFTVGAEYELRFGNVIGWVTQFNFIYNPVDEEGVRAQAGLQNYPSVTLSTSPWIMYTPVTGIKLTGTMSPDVAVFLAGAVGATFGTSPELNITGPGGSIKEPSASATAFAFSVSGGLVISEKFRLSIKYVSSKPKYEMSMTASTGAETMSSSGNMEQGSSVVLVEAGYEF